MEPSPRWNPAYETLQFPLLFLHGESGWSEGHSKETPPYKSKTKNRANDSHVPFPFTAAPKRNIFLGKIADRGAEGAAQRQQHFTNPFSYASPSDILHVGNVGKLEEVGRCFSAAQQQQHSSSGGGDVELPFWSQHPESNQNAK